MNSYHSAHFGGACHVQASHWEGGTVRHPVLQLGKPKHGEVKYLTHVSELITGGAGFGLTQVGPRVHATGVARALEWKRALPAVDPVCAEIWMWQLWRTDRAQLELSGSQLE